MVEPVLEDEFTYPDGCRVVVVAHRVPESEEYPSGIKYRFQYMDPGGKTLLRYDNAPHHDAGAHHEHRGEDTVNEVSYTSLADHYQQFRREVEEIYARRTE